MSQIEAINPLALKQQVTSPKAATSSKDFNSFIGAVDAMSPMAGAASQQYGSPNSSTVLAAAFSGVSTLNGTAGGAPYMSAGFGGVGGTGGFAAGYKQQIGGSSLFPGTGNDFSQADLINNMNQNNLQMLELQAVMQSNMQGWNTKSNIISADHRARMNMIEKFTAR